MYMYARTIKKGLRSRFSREWKKPAGIPCSITIVILKTHATTFWLQYIDLYTAILSHTGPLKNTRVDENLSSFQSCLQSQKPTLSHRKVPTVETKSKCNASPKRPWVCKEKVWLARTTTYRCTRLLAAKRVKSHKRDNLPWKRNHLRKIPGTMYCACVQHIVQYIVH